MGDEAAPNRAEHRLGLVAICATAVTLDLSESAATKLAC
jgi:hypothetical protein